jgi:hypothetical protein
MLIEKGEAIVKIDEKESGLEMVDDNATRGWWVSERDWHRYITAKSNLLIATHQLLSMRLF